MRFVKIIAILVLIWGMTRLAMGLYVAIVFEGSPDAASRYLGSGNSGEAIDQGIYRVVFALALLIIVRLLRRSAPN